MITLVITFLLHIFVRVTPYLFQMATDYRIGEASNPGPSHDQDDQGYLLEVANVTHLSNKAYRPARSGFDAMVISEHPLSLGQKTGLRDKLGKDVFYHLSNLVPDKACQLGGVGILAKEVGPIIPKVLNPALSAITDQSRFGMYAIEIARNVIVHIYQVYGVPNGTHDPDAAAVTNGILHHILMDVEM